MPWTESVIGNMEGRMCSSPKRPVARQANQKKKESHHGMSMYGLSCGATIQLGRGLQGFLVER